MSWTVLHDAGRNRAGQRLVSARCVCGTVRTLTHDNIKRGNSKSCGCLARKSGHSRQRAGAPSPTYVSWQAMRTRCLNPRAADYPDYGGRGIGIAAQWDSFEVFLTDMGERPAGHTLDRRDVNGDYAPDNCRWATTHEQRANQRPHKRSVKCVSA